ncbi:MAG: PLDc N-terminal domain-containing protein [Desulfovibrionaceae bacterium]|nr:PLDc N-terminal domain-containing protein [Desulfovibrionaceae bacterium]
MMIPMLSLEPWQLALLFVPALINLLAILHACLHGFATAQERHLWILLNIMIPILGGIIYFIFGRCRTVSAPSERTSNRL